MLQASLPELVSAFTYALDAAEGREPGHAVKVAYIASLIARELDLNEDAPRAAFYAGLLHDIGVPNATAALTSAVGVDEELLFGFAPLHSADAVNVPAAQRAQAQDALRMHVTAGTAFLTAPWFPEATHQAVEVGHENWDGSGYPAGLRNDAIPIVGRILRAADLYECVIAGESNPLSSRAKSQEWLRAWSGSEIQPQIGEALLRISNYDSFWLGLYDTSIGETLIHGASGAGVRPSGLPLASFSEAVAALIDVKADHPTGRSRRVSEYVRTMALAVGMSPESVEMMTLAALWNDVGALGVPGRILVKPDLLSLDEMERMRSHPAFSGEILARIPALRPAAR